MRLASTDAIVSEVMEKELYKCPFFNQLKDRIKDINAIIKYFSITYTLNNIGEKGERTEVLKTDYYIMYLTSKVILISDDTEKFNKHVQDQINMKYKNERDIENDSKAFFEMKHLKNMSYI